MWGPIGTHKAKKGCKNNAAVSLINSVVYFKSTPMARKSEEDDSSSKQAAVGFTEAEKRFLKQHEVLRMLLLLTSYFMMMASFTLPQIMTRESTETLKRTKISPW
jgi:hypothetical protein